CDREPVLKRAQKLGVMDEGESNPLKAVSGSQIILLATPVGAIIELIERLGPTLSPQTLLTHVCSTKARILSRAKKIFGNSTRNRFLAGHPMAGKEHSGVEFADPNLFQGAAWLVTPSPGQNVHEGLSGEFLKWVKKIGARIATIDAEEHDLFCAWISHLPQLISTALAALLVDEYGNKPMLDVGGRA